MNTIVTVSLVVLVLAPLAAFVALGSLGLALIRLDFRALTRGSIAFLSLVAVSLVAGTLLSASTCAPLSC